MVNYYEILGLNTKAEVTEIKSAFRRLAKLYHPDKNPNDKELFSKILKAYETLSDPRLKLAYDYKLRNQQHQLQNDNTLSNKRTEKNWRFDEKELKRRQYYNDYLKKQTAKSNISVELEKRSDYNEYKYILLATPLAVILFLLIMKLSDSGKQIEKKDTNQPTNPSTFIKSNR